MSTRDNSDAPVHSIQQNAPPVAPVSPPPAYYPPASRQVPFDSSSNPYPSGTYPTPRASQPYATPDMNPEWEEEGEDRHMKISWVHGRDICKCMTGLIGILFCCCAACAC